MGWKAPGGARGVRRQLPTMCNFPGHVWSRDPQIQGGGGSRTPPQALRLALAQGTASAGLRTPGPSCPPGHRGGRVPTARRSRGRAHRSR